MLSASVTEPALSDLLAERTHFVGFLQRRGATRTQAEDLVQEAFTRALTRASQLQQSARARAWFYRILRNVWVDHLRRHNSEVRMLEQVEHEPPANRSEVQAEAKACTCIAPLAQQLNAGYRHALQRIEVEGVSVAAYAAEQGISANNAAVRVLRARNALRQRVVRCCGQCAAQGCVDCDCKRG